MSGNVSQQKLVIFKKRSEGSSATTHQLRIVAGGSGALGSPRPKKEKEAEEVGVTAEKTALLTNS